jgi:hypothetical protein
MLTYAYNLNNKQLTLRTGLVKGKNNALLP